MRLLIFFLLLSIAGYGQTTYYIQADSTRLRKIGANNELILENATRATTGVLVNYGNGRTRFSKPRINGDTLFVGVDTITGLGVANIYNSNGTITGNRTVSGGGFDLTWNNMGHVNFNGASGKTFNVSADDIYFQSSSAFGGAIVDVLPIRIALQAYDATFTDESDNFIDADSISWRQGLGKFNINKLRIATNMTGRFVMVWDSVYGKWERIVKDSIGGSSSSYTFTNGLTEAAGTVKLGGTLSDATTTINASENGLTIDSLSQLSITAINGIWTSFVTQSGDNGFSITGINSSTGRISNITVPPDAHISIAQDNGVDSASSIEVTLAGISLKPDRGALFIDSLTSGVSTDSVLVWDAGSTKVRMRDAAAFGGSGLTIGDAITGGTANRVLFEGAGNVLSQDPNYVWSGLKLGIGTPTPVGKATFKLSTTGIAPGSIAAWDSTTFLIGNGGDGATQKGMGIMNNGTDWSTLYIQPGVAWHSSSEYLSYKAIYSNGSGTPSLVATAGKVSIGLAVGIPTAILQLPGGTASAGSAPIKINSGTNLTTAEAGAIEYDGTNFSATNSTATRRTIVLSGVGTATASANDLTLPKDGNVFHITGATQLNAIVTSGWPAGSEITLIFNSNPTVKNNTAGGGGTALLLLAGGADFSATANDVLKLVYDGTSWFEVSRSVN